MQQEPREGALGVQLAGERPEPTASSKTTQRLSNHLSALAEDVKMEAEAFAAAERASAEHALNAGRLLAEAKQACPHGGWLPFLKRAGVAERSAQRWMQLHRGGLKSDLVTDLGGVVPALQFIKLREHIGQIYSELTEAMLKDGDIGGLSEALIANFDELVAMLPPDEVDRFYSHQSERPRSLTRQQWAATINASWRECIDSFQQTSADGEAS